MSLLENHCQPIWGPGDIDFLFQMFSAIQLESTSLRESIPLIYEVFIQKIIENRKHNFYERWNYCQWLACYYINSFSTANTLKCLQTNWFQADKLCKITWSKISTWFSHITWLKMATASRMSRFYVLFSLCIVCYGQTTNYIIGAGIADITGPAAEVDMVCGFFYKFFNEL